MNHVKSIGGKSGLCSFVYAYKADYLDFKFYSIIEIDNDNSLDKLTNLKVSLVCNQS
jgi:hypothetical protein